MPETAADRLPSPPVLALIARMDREQFQFERFVLDCRDRRLTRDGAPVDLNGRYFDALALLVRKPGALVTKEEFLGDVWGGVPVTDEALTQAIRAIRRQLGDDAARPSFIETVPKHGYRFIAEVAPSGGSRPTASADLRTLRTGISGTIGGTIAGAVGGLLYGLVATAQSLAPGAGAMSLLAVLFSLSVAVACLGAAGVSFGIAGAALLGRKSGALTIAGGALGGLTVGALVKLLGSDAFALLVGQPLGNVTGAVEGAAVGASVGLAAWLSQWPSPRLGDRHRLALAALAGGAGGLLIALAGGRLMAGSLAAMVDRFPGARLHLDPLGTLFGEDGFGPIGQAVTATLEGALFAACVVGAMLYVRRPNDGAERSRDS